MAQYSVSAQSLKAAVLAVAKSAARDDARPQLAGIHLVLGPNRLETAAADGFRLARHTCPDVHESPDYDSRATLNAKQLVAFVKAMPKSCVSVDVTPADMGPVPAWVFSSPSHAFAPVDVAIIPGTYPDYNQIIPDIAAATTTADIDRASWRDALEPVKPVDRKASTPPAIAHLWLRETDPAITASNTPHDPYISMPYASVTGKDQTISVNPAYLRDVLATAPKDADIILRVASPHQAIRVDVGAHTTHVIMPVVHNADLPSPEDLRAAAMHPQPEPERPAPAITWLHGRKPAPVTTRGRYRAVVPLACSQCGSHEVNFPDGPKPYCNECGGAAELDPNVVYGPHVAELRAEVSDHGGWDVDAARRSVALKREHRRASREVTIDDQGRVLQDDGTPLATSPEPVRVNRYCAECGAEHEPADRYCGMCGTRIDPPDTTPDGREILTPAEVRAMLAQDTGHDEPREIIPGYVPIRHKYSGKNPARILEACPHATDVRGFHDWLKVGRCVMKGQKGIMIYTPARGSWSDGAAHEDADGVIDERRRPRVKKAYVFDISQTAPYTPKRKGGATHTSAAAD